eukprot:GGOE01002390.1.p1 GENE.GGOE01002390.1~~GGOE01002390.1.p1  ORF type:complete len:331 (-),score=57.65 GGOE01002390.1:241-1146(-)
MSAKGFRRTHRVAPELQNADPPSLQRQHAPRTAPYYSLSAWRSALDDLFSCDCAANQRAVPRIASWRFRARTLGFATEFAFRFARLQALESRQHTMDDEELAALYCMALLRLVNGLVEEVANTNQKEKVSVFQALRVLQLPRSFGVFRHDATHGALPSLSEVRTAAQQAMEWLRASYWKPLRAQAISLETKESQSTATSSVATCPREVWWDWHTSVQANDAVKDVCISNGVPSPTLSLEQLEAALQRASAPAPASRWVLADEFEAVPIGWLPPSAAMDLFGIKPTSDCCQPDDTLDRVHRI